MRVLWAAILGLAVVACGPTNSGGSGSGGPPADGGNGGSGGGGGGSDGGTPVPVQHALHLGVRGNGEVRSANPAFSCRADCDQSFDSAATAQLVAIPDPGWKFDSWQGDCSGNAGCSIAMSADRAVTATFSAVPPPPPGNVRVSVIPTGNGGGRITSAPAGIDCPGTCSMSVQSGSGVSLTAQPDGSSTFAGWGGGCSGGGACNLTATSDVTVWANFTANAPPPPPPPPPVNQCAAISAPDAVAMEQYVARPQAGVSCGIGVGDAGGTLAMTMSYQDPNNHGSLIDFVRSGTGFVREQYSSSESLRPLQQPNGLASSGDPGHMWPYRRSVRLGRWNTSGDWLGDAVWGADNFAPAADPNGGVFLAGDLTNDVTSASARHEAVMFTGGGAAYAIKWGPQPLASNGAVFGAGVDMLGRAIVITDGVAFGSGTISAQWFDRDGTPLTGDFVLITGFVAGQSTWFETWPLIGGGVVIVRMDADIPGGVFHSRAIAQVQSGKATVLPPDAWMTAHTDVRLQIARGGKAYAVLPFGAKNVACTQKMEILAPDGTSCGARDYPIAAGNCDTSDLMLGQDGTVIQQLPTAMETVTNPYTMFHTCTWHFWSRTAH